MVVRPAPGFPGKSQPAALQTAPAPPPSVTTVHFIGNSDLHARRHGARSQPFNIRGLNRSVAARCSSHLQRSSADPRWLPPKSMLMIRRCRHLCSGTTIAAPPNSGGKFAVIRWRVEARVGGLSRIKTQTGWRISTSPSEGL